MTEARLSNRVRNITPSQTLAVDARTKALIRQGKPVINMSVGEPDFDTPVKAAYAGIKAIADGQTRYTPAAGLLDLRKAIAQKLMAENGLTYTPEQIVVSSGAKHSLYNLFLAICNPGDEVVLPAPYWVSYPEQIRMADATPVIVSCSEETGFKLTPTALRNAITPRTRAVLLNSPNNPTGAVYSEAELRALGEVLLGAPHVYVITDEIYERLVYDVEHKSIVSLVPGLLDRALLVNGFSKAFAMTGWRLGYVAAPADIAKAISSLQSHATGSPSTMSQYAGIAAFDAFDPAVVDAFHQRRDVLVKGLNEIEGINCLRPDGAFYAFPNVSGLFGKRHGDTVITDASALCEALLDCQLVSCVPGSAFGSPENMRLSYAVSLDDIEEALRRIRAFTAVLE